MPIRKSVTPDAIICLEDGKKLKMLKRHLASAYNMTPDQYRARWGLASDYPMVAPNYAQQRSTLAKKIGLGTGRARAGAHQGAAGPEVRCREVSLSGPERAAPGRLPLAAVSGDAPVKVVPSFGDGGGARRVVSATGPSTA